MGCPNPAVRRRDEFSSLQVYCYHAETPINRQDFNNMPMNRKLLDTLWNLHQSRLSGVLRADRGSEKKQLIVNKGLLVFAESNLPNEHLARVLVKLDLLPKTSLKDIASVMKDGKTSEEAILQIPGSNPKDIERGRREQAIGILASLWAWDHFEIHIYASESLIRHQVNLGIPLPEMMVVSARRAVSDGLVRVPRSLSQGLVFAAEGQADHLADLSLSPAESRAYSLLQRPMSTVDALPLISGQDEKPEQLLLLLYLLGLIAVKAPVQQPRETADSVESSSILSSLDDKLAYFESASLYEILSIPLDADQDAIQVAYHSLARQFHPDRFQSREFSEETRSRADQIFTCVNNAYITLKDPVLRADYDEKRLTKESKVEAELKARAAKQSEDEKTAEALFRDGRALLAVGQFEKAIERLKGCVWLNPDKAVYYHYLGKAESEVPKLRKSAEQHLLRSLELDKMANASRLELVRLYIKVELRRKAELQLRELEQWDPGNSEVQKLLADLKKLDTPRAGRGAQNSSLQF
jgi:curved DNA-binding protein CbpA